LISALISSSTRNRVEKLIGNEQIHILASSELLAELEGVAMRPSIQKYIKHEHVNQFIALLTRRFDVVPVTSVV
jgi:putative PIN family toxin of toxin-antitoxin system